MAKKQAYFIGIGGIGMSALARYFLAQKWAVSGSDLTESSITEELRKEGVRVKIGQEKGNINPGLDLVIRTQAITPENSEFVAAKELKLRVLTYPEAVGALTLRYQTIAIAGAHGKSTTTAMTAKVLLENGFDPAVILGSKYKLFGGKNFRAGKDYFILEADEYGGAFWHYSPTLAVVTNIDREHLDFYEDLAKVKDSFLKFLGNTRKGGALILNKDDKNLASLRSRIMKLAKINSLKVIWYSLRDKEAKEIKNVLPLPGTHNISNALAAFNVGRVLGISKKNIISALSGYEGIWRRMELRGNLAGADTLLFDDYGHHPAEIKATLAALREKYPDKKLICVFQPHQAKRLEILFKDFILAFKNADALILLPSYKVAGRDEKCKYSSELLEAELKKKYPKREISYLPNEVGLKAALLAASRGPSVAVLMGAGNISDYTDGLLS
jgi:UDP-N-acetylmuramate--alanine ligase